MVIPLDLGRACRSAGKGGRQAALAMALGLIYALSPPGARASTISKEFTGHALHHRWEGFVHGLTHLEHQVFPHKTHAAGAVHHRSAVAPHVAAQMAPVSATAPLSTHQIHAAAMEVSQQQVATSVVQPLMKITAVDGLLPRSPATVYLEMRRDLNPERFDRYHHKLGGILAEDERLRGAQQVGSAALDTRPVTAAQEAAPPTAPCGVLTHAVNPAAQTVPEPGTATIALTLIGAAALARRFRRKA